MVRMLMAVETKGPETPAARPLDVEQNDGKIYIHHCPRVPLQGNLCFPLVAGRRTYRHGREDSGTDRKKNSGAKVFNSEQLR